VNRHWLDQPVHHLRDVRIELLVKLTLRERAGMSNASLLKAQQETFEPTIDALISANDVGLVELWRRESARAVRRFLDQAVEPTQLPEAAATMRLSARNQLHGTITAVDHGEVMSTVKSVLAEGQTVTAVITEDAARDLDLARGDQATMLIKSTEVMVAKSP
jgi:molybdate transport system regulatory protein